MTPIPETIAYFARRMRVEEVFLVGRREPLAKYLPDYIRFQHLDDRSDVALQFRPSSNTLVAVAAFDGTTPPVMAKARLNAWAERARAVLCWDPGVQLIGPGEGFQLIGDAPIFRPFGLDLGFSLFDPRLPAAPPKPTSRPIHPIIACYNEVDIIEACIESLLRDGAVPIVMDNWSTDGTYEALQSYAEAGRIELMSYPASGPVANYEWRRLLAAKEQLAATRPGAWIIHQDADEIRHGAFPDLSLAQNLQIVEDYGCNAIDYTVLNFRPIDNTWARGQDPEHCFTHFEFGESRDDYTRQIKAWLSGSHRGSLAEQAGHEVRFPSRAVYPYKFMLKHYPLRSDEHGRRKLRKDRMPRFSAAERSLGWHTHYDHMAQNETFLRQAEDLVRFDAAGTGGVGASFVTSLPPSDPNAPIAEPAPIAQPRVWLPAKAVVVIDLPPDPAMGFARSVVLDHLVTTVKAGFETVTAICLSPEGATFAAERGLPSEVVDFARYVENGGSPMARSIALSRRLAERDDAYVFGLAAGGALAASAVLKTQDLGFADKRLIAVLGATTGQCLRDLGVDLHTPEHLEIDHLECLSISRADECLSCTAAEAQEWIDRGVGAQAIAVVPPRPAGPDRSRQETAQRIDQVAFLGPMTGIDFETLTINLKAIGEAAPGLPVSFVGPFGVAFGEHAGGFLVRSAAGWRVNIGMAPYPGLTNLSERLVGANALVVIGRCGGAETLLAHALAAKGLACLVVGDRLNEAEFPLGRFVRAADGRDGLRDAVLSALHQGVGANETVAALPIGDCDLSYWESWASGLLGRAMSEAADREDQGKGKAADGAGKSRPLVTVGIPHFERAHHLLETVEGFLAQTYPNLEIIVVDDGSRSEEDLATLRALQITLERAGGRVVHQQNAYLGAARNTAFAHARGEYVLFFDDDDYPHPDMVDRMVRAIEARRADVVSANINFWETGELPEDFDAVRCSSCFLGAAPALAVYRNPFGSAAVMVRRSAFEKLGGYTTDYGIGWEDYEFSARVCLEGFVYENIPQALYLYRINYRGMASTTPTLANGRRVWRLLEQYADDPRMAVVLRATYMDRLWREDKVAKFQWHTILGDRTTIYHRLSRLPFNSRESQELLCSLAEIEGQLELSMRLRETLLNGAWALPGRRVTSSPNKKKFNGERALENALLLHRMGATEEAVGLLKEVANSSSSAGKDAAIGLAFLYLLQGRSDLTIDYATQVLQLDSNDPEALFALSVAARAVSDSDTVVAADRAFEAALAQQLQNETPTLAGLSATEVLECWANTLSREGRRLVRFKAFPNSVEGELLRRYHGWRPLFAAKAEFEVQMPAFGQWIADEHGVFLHPSDPGRVSVVRLDLPEAAALVGVAGEANVQDDRASPVEATIVLTPEATEAAMADLVSMLEGRKAWLGSGAPPIWTRLLPGIASQLVQAQSSVPVRGKSVVVATRMSAAAANNWHAATYIRRLRLQVRPND